MNKFKWVSSDGHQMSLAGWGGPQVNKSEQVSSDGHQMTVAGWLGLGMSDVQGVTVYNLRIHLNLSVQTSCSKINLPRWKSTCPDYYITNIYHLQHSCGK